MIVPASPITKKNNTSVTDSFLSGDVIALYKQQLGIDVSGFFKGIPKFSLYQCNDTGYKFYYPRKLNGDGAFYASLQNKLGEHYYHDWKFENQLAYDHLGSTDKVLDIGCGTGNFLMYAKSKTNNVYGLELNKNAISLCRKKGLSVYNQFIEEHAHHNEEAYDVVCMFQVLEHVYDVKGFLEAAIKVLKKGGKMIIGVPNCQPYFFGYDKYCTLNLPPHHMGMWNKEVFENLAAIYNLSVLKVEYDISGRFIAESYLRAKYLAGIKSLPDRHSLTEKIKMVSLAPLTIPATLIRKVVKGPQGSHMAVLFEKL